MIDHEDRREKLRQALKEGMDRAKRLQNAPPKNQLLGSDLFSNPQLPSFVPAQEETEERGPPVFTEPMLELAKRISLLPADFPINTFDTMTTVQQLKAVQRSGLSREDQWLLLNAESSLKTVAELMDIQNNRSKYGLSNTQADQLCQELLKIDNARMDVQKGNNPFVSSSDQRMFFKMLEEREQQLLETFLIGSKQPIVSSAIPHATGAQPVHTPNPYQQNNWMPKPGPSPAMDTAQFKLLNDLREKVKQDLNILEIAKSTNGIVNALSTVLHYENTIQRISKKYCVPKEMIQTVMFREQLFYDFRDDFADLLDKLNLRSASSTGVMQILGNTAITAINKAVDNEITTYEDLGLGSRASLSCDNPRDYEEIWKRLNTDAEFNIEVGALNLLSCASEMVKRTDFENFSPEEMIATLSRYNGTTDVSQQYGIECYHWYPSFIDYNLHEGD